jgi:transcriptional regulator with XRE-family HTH domain
MELKERIKILRKSTGMTQPEFSLFCGLKSSQVMHIEQGNIEATNTMLEKIADKYPEYRYWIHTGNECPNDGQISPMTKHSAEKLGTC